MLRKGPRQIGMAAIMIVLASQQVMSMRITASADNIMHPATIGIHTVPIQGVCGQGCHWPKVGKGAPHPITYIQVRAMQRAGLARIKSFGRIFGGP